jgi:hypothetical protein
MLNVTLLHTKEPWFAHGSFDACNRNATVDTDRYPLN